MVILIVSLKKLAYMLFTNADSYFEIELFFCILDSHFANVHTGQVLRKIVNATDFEFKDILRFATIFSHYYDFLRFSVRTPKICYALLRFSAIATIFYDFRSATENMLRFIYK